MEVNERHEVLGTVVEIRLADTHSSFFSPCFKELKRIEQTYSRFLDSSELSNLNKNLNTWQSVSPEMLYLLESAEEAYKKTGGYFDITLKATLDRLGYDKQYSFKPARKKKEHKKRFAIDRENSKVFLYREIEFGGLGKGFALDQVASLLDSCGISHYYINAGGDIFAKSSKKPWTILLEHPDNPKVAIGKVELEGCAIAASAPNRRAWGEHHHLINPKTKQSAQGVKGIFVVARTGIEADAYATGIFCAGFEEGIKLASRCPVEVLLISSKDKMYQSPGFKVTFFE